MNDDDRKMGRAAAVRPDKEVRSVVIGISDDYPECWVVEVHGAHVHGPISLGSIDRVAARENPLLFLEWKRLMKLAASWYIAKLSEQYNVDVEWAGGPEWSVGIP